MSFLVREMGLEPTRLWLDTGTSSLPVCLFQHSRKQYSLFSAKFIIAWQQYLSRKRSLLYRADKTTKKTIHASNAWLSTRGITPRSSQTRTTCNTVCQLRGVCYLRPLKGRTSGITICSDISSSFSWFLTYSVIRASFLPTVST